MKPNQLERFLRERTQLEVFCKEDNGSIVLEGKALSWDQVVAAGKLAAGKGYRGVVNKIEYVSAPSLKPSLPKVQDSKLQGRHVDVLIIGAGVVGSAIARELSKWNLKIMLIDKESDVALHQSSRNAGVAHPPIAPKPGSLKALYNRRGLELLPHLSKELDFPFKQIGMTILVPHRLYKIGLPIIFSRMKQNGVNQFKFLSGDNIRSVEPFVTDKAAWAIFLPEGGILDPFNMTLAFAENAVENGAEVSLETAALSINMEHGSIVSVTTNRGTVYPRVVVNAAGIWSDLIAEMAGDMFFTIHPRKGETVILDKKKGKFARTCLSMPSLAQTSSDTKGGGLIPTVDGNILLGPNAHEVPEREDYSTSTTGIEEVLNKQMGLIKGLSPSDVITYFAGTRAATYEEDFIVERSKRVQNLVHVAGIQSPGITAAPAIAEDVASMCLEILASQIDIKPNPKFSPMRRSFDFKGLTLEEKQKVIRENPDYGVVICRCEGVTKGEIEALFSSPIPPTTLDGIKRRSRAGMGRCQGGFCTPFVLEIMKEKLNLPPTEITKKGGKSFVVSEYTRVLMEGGKNEHSHDK